MIENKVESQEFKTLEEYTKAYDEAMKAGGYDSMSETPEEWRLRTFNEHEPHKVTPTDGYNSRPVSWFKENILPDLLITKERLQLGPSFVDIGCAYGYFTKIMAEHFTHVTGVDYCPNRIAGAKEHNAAPNIDYLLLDLTKEPIPGQYDWAISSAVYQHINPLNGDRRKAFINTFNAIKDGGYLVLYDENFEMRQEKWSILF